MYNTIAVRVQRAQSGFGSISNRIAHLQHWNLGKYRLASGRKYIYEIRSDATVQPVQSISMYTLIEKGRDPHGLSPESAIL
jgi:hypothetical protein